MMNFLILALTALTVPWLEDTGTTVPATRTQMPNDADLLKAENDIRAAYPHAFEADLDDDKKRANSKEFIAYGHRSKNPATRVVFARLVQDFSIETVDLGAGVDSAHLLASTIDGFDAWPEIIRLAKKLSESKPRFDHRTAMRYTHAIEGLAWSGLNQRDFARTQDIVSIYRDESGRFSARTKKDRSFLARNLKIQEADNWARLASQAQQRLTANPADRDAAFDSGLFECAVMDNWTNGLPGLSKGSGPAAQAAERELKSPTEPTEILDIARLWLEAGTHGTGLTQTAFFRRALLLSSSANLDLDPPQARLRDSLVAELQQKLGSSDPSSSTIVEQEPPKVSKLIGIELLQNGDFEEPPTSDGIPGWTQAQGDWMQRDKDTNRKLDDVTRGRYFIGPAGEPARSEAILMQSVDVSDAAPEIDSSKIRVRLKASITCSPLDNEDLAKISLRFVDDGGDSISAATTQAEFVTHWKEQRIDLEVPSRTRCIEVRLIAIRSGGKKINAYFDNLSMRMTRQ